MIGKLSTSHTARAVRTVAFAAISALLTGATAAHAQKSSQSDITGVVVSSGDVAGGVFSTIPGQVPSITSPVAVTAVMTSIQALGTAVQSVTTAVAAAIPASDAGTAATPGVAPAMPPALAGVLGCAASCSTQTAALNVALSGSGGVPTVRVEALTTALQDLGASVTSGTADIPTIAANMTAARTAFVRLIENADASYLSNPPAEVVAVYKMMTQLINAANSK